MKRLCLALALALLLCALSGCVRRGGEPVPEFAFRYAENQAEDYPTTLAAFFFADRVAELSGGRIRVYVYPDAELGDERSIIEQMQYGGIDFGRVNLSPLSEYDQRLFTLQLPYLYEDSVHMWRVLGSEIGDSFLQGVGAIDLVGLAWVDAGARNFYTQAPVHSVEDMQGLLIRVQENIMMERLVALLGADAIQMRYSDVLPALQTGKIDGAENNYPSYWSTGHYLVAQHMILDEHSRIPEMILASKATMQRLGEEDRALIAQAAAEASLYQRELWQEYEARTRDLVVESGCVLYTVPPGEKAAFQAVTAQMIPEFAGDMMDIVERINAMRQTP